VIAAGTAYVYLFVPGLHNPVMNQLFNLLIDPGWRAAVWMIPGGIHAGTCFFVVSGILNTAMIFIVVFCLLSAVRYVLLRKNARA